MNVFRSRLRGGGLALQNGLQRTQLLRTGTTAQRRLVAAHTMMRPLLDRPEAELPRRPANVPGSTRRISSFHMDDSPRGKLEPYMGAIKLVSAVAGLVVVSIGGLYLAVNHYLDANWPAPKEVTRRETRRLLRGAALREHLAPNPQVAYLFLLRALEQIYADGVLAEGSEAVQELVVRLARAADQMGESGPALNMLWESWRRCTEEKDNGYEDVWRRKQVCRVAEVLGPMVMRSGDAQAAIEVYGRALREAKGLDDGMPDSDVQGLDDLRVVEAGFVASLGEAFALSGDLDSARVLLQGLLGEIRERNERRLAEKPANARLPVDKWTCLDAIVMLDLAQVALRQEGPEQSSRWALSGLEATQAQKGVRACDNCQSHLVCHLALLAERSGDLDNARRLYATALEHSRKTHTGNIEQIKQNVERIDELEKQKTLGSDK
ncbi:hypothetical protein GGI07_003848 [Coemansia sp. Benny D115]|nr:hypothetical protein GGI07_003848 [Coemansia sp. Benny D115]